MVVELEVDWDDLLGSNGGNRTYRPVFPKRIFSLEFLRVGKSI